ncbi:ribosomal protein L5 domain-containing protein [Hyaloraphidium curvatum]|nr:ribosomal protein L5 domain-containing protein [Hyaloraphidium curvatum]
MSRLEFHYLNTLREDMMILQYDHASRIVRNIDTNPEWIHGIKAPDDMLSKLFSVQNPIRRDRVPGGGIKRYGGPLPMRRHTRPFLNPIDYSSHKPGREWRILPTDPFPYAPLASRLPKIESITLYCFPKLASQNKMSVLHAIMALQSISGCKAEPYFAAHSDAALGIKAGHVAGAVSTIEEGDRMWSFLDRFVNCVLPRVREWEGYNGRQAWKDNGEIRLHLDAQAVGYFPEIEPYFDQYPQLHDMEISFQTTAKFRNEAISLLSGFQIPFLDRETELATLEQAKKAAESKDPFAKFRTKKRQAGINARGTASVTRAKRK